jgi:hypothetical protein
MFEDTCFVALKIKDQNPCILHPRNPRILDLVVFIRWVQNKFS